MIHIQYRCLCVFSVLCILVLFILYKHSCHETFTDVSTLAPTLTNCQKVCDNSGTLCQAYTYTPNTRNCTIIAVPQINSGITKTDTTSYILPASLQALTPGSYTSKSTTAYDDTGLLVTKTTANVDECKKVCSLLQNCVGYTFDSTSSLCKTYSAWGTSSANANVTMYNKACTVAGSTANATNTGCNCGMHRRAQNW